MCQGQGTGGSSARRGPCTVPQQPRRRARPSPSAAVAAPRGERCLRKGETPQRQREARNKSERNSPAVNDRRRRRRGGAAGAGAKVPHPFPGFHSSCSPKVPNREKACYQPKSKSHQLFPQLSRRDCLGRKGGQGTPTTGQLSTSWLPPGNQGSAPHSPCKLPCTLLLSSDRKWLFVYTSPHV